MGIEDAFGQSSNSEQALIEHYHLAEKDIAQRIRAIIGG
jgi:transketolase C-terminal domain/subunit